MKTILSLALLFCSVLVFGQAAPAAPAPATTGGQGIDVNIILLILAVFLLFPIGALANAFTMAAHKRLMDNRKMKALKVLIPVAFVLSVSQVHAQAAAEVAKTSGGASAQTTTIVLLSLIGVELFILLFFAIRISELVKVEKAKEAAAAHVRTGLFERLKKIWSSLNFKPIEEEYKIDLGHNYDGIRELDNVIPPWFTTAFLLTILFAGVYLYRYHVSKSAPGQLEELKIAMAKADLEHEALLSTQANAIDETSVGIMTGADLEAGKKTFTTICAACHRTDGGGQVGPNLTDDYWIHGGGIHNVFKTIKYGVPDKGMISWKEQLSPMQIAQVANYILTLRGTNPPDPKEKQGDLYVPEGGAAPDTTAAAKPAKVDSTAVKK